MWEVSVVLKVDGGGGDSARLLHTVATDSAFSPSKRGQGKQGPHQQHFQGTRLSIQDHHPLFNSNLQM